MKFNIGSIKGDGIGPEIVNEAQKVLKAVAKKYGHDFEFTELLMGGASIDVNGVPLTDETIEIAKKMDAVLMGSIGGDANTSPWYKLEPSKRPEAGLLKIRKALGLFAVRLFCIENSRLLALLKRSLLRVDLISLS